MAESKKTEITESTSDRHATAAGSKAIKHSSSGGSEKQERKPEQPTQSNRLTYDSVKATIGTRQASLLERRTLPPITKQLQRKLSRTPAVSAD